MASLEILIPTYNRGPKLGRAVRMLAADIDRAGLAASVRIRISDNASTDDTPAIGAALVAEYSNVTYIRQPVNRGIDGNMRELYARAESDYVWYFSDDDLLVPGAVRAVFDALLRARPDVLLFSFRQPADSPDQTFRYPESIHIVDVPSSIVECVALFPKISIYVLRNLKTLDLRSARHEKMQGTAYWWVYLTLDVIAAAERPCLAVISRVLATSDDEFRSIRFGPQVWKGFHRVLEHEFTCRHAANVLRKYETESYYNDIYFTYAVIVGDIQPEHPREYIANIARIGLRPSLLLQRPRAAAHFILLKTRTARLARSIWRWANVRRAQSAAETR